jgi:hypothetical protein
MINIGKILKRSWHILWSYRVLWIFGILLAITTGVRSNGNNGSGSQGIQNNNVQIPGVLPQGTPQWVQQFADWFTHDVEPIFTHPAQHVGTLVLFGVILFLVILVISAIAALVRYPSETAVMRMVDEYEQSGVKLSFRKGWKLGWTRRAFRLWLIDLILAIPVVVLVLLIAGAGLIVYFNVSATFQITSVIGVVAAIGLGFISVLLLFLLAVFIKLLRNFFARAVALDDLGVRAALQHGWGMFKRNWKSAGLMWLVMVGIGLGFGIAGIIVFFVLIPAYLVMLIPAALVAAVPALAAYGIASIFTSGPLVWIIAAVAAIPFFFIVVLAPLFLFDGWYKIYQSNVWTLTYREIKALESLAAAPAVVPAVEAPQNMDTPPEA